MGKGKQTARCSSCGQRIRRRKNEEKKKVEKLVARVEKLVARVPPNNHMIIEEDQASATAAATQIGEPSILMQEDHTILAPHPLGRRPNTPEPMEVSIDSGDEEIGAVAPRPLGEPPMFHLDDFLWNNGGLWFNAAGSNHRPHTSADGFLPDDVIYISSSGEEENGGP